MPAPAYLSAGEPWFGKCADKPLLPVGFRWQERDDDFLYAIGPDGHRWILWGTELLRMKALTAEDLDDPDFAWTSDDIGKLYVSDETIPLWEIIPL